jgi:hypothetical protein
MSQTPGFKNPLTDIEDTLPTPTLERFLLQDKLTSKERRKKKDTVLMSIKERPDGS